MKYPFLLLAVISLLTSGCGLIPRTGEPSKALQVADAMEIPASDMARAEYERRLKDAGAKQGSLGTDNMIMGALLGDPAMFLLGGLTPKSISSYVQYAAWVPQSKAKDADAAIEVARDAMRQALISASPEVSPEKFEYGVRHALGVPYGEGTPAHAVVQLKHLLGSFTPELQQAPVFMATTEKVYGPIFINIGTWYSTAEDAQVIHRVANALPSWYYQYDPGYPGVSPRLIRNSGRSLVFVAPK